ncbi:SDR family oxidoreductase [Janibacter sp. G1551]|uniref:SDR family oxidoreductase n=1 Tax=Janibacter sp. G1551 TaxID=3420440 RepID=UPI003D08E19D
MSRITIIGGHGKVALLLEPLLVAQGHDVAAVIRNPEHTGDVEGTGARAVVAHVETMSAQDLAALFAEQDAIVWSAGAGGGDPARTVAVDRDAAIRSMDAAAAAGVRRYVMVSYFGAGPDHGVPEDNPFHAYAEAKSQADAHLATTDLDWTILRPSALTSDAGTGRIETGDGVTPGRVSRANVAAVAAAVVGSADTYGRTIPFNDGDTPIEGALS